MGQAKQRGTYAMSTTRPRYLNTELKPLRELPPCLKPRPVKPAPGQIWTFRGGPRHDIITSVGRLPGFLRKPHRVIFIHWASGLRSITARELWNDFEYAGIFQAIGPSLRDLPIYIPTAGKPPPHPSFAAVVDLLDWAETLLCNSDPMAHCPQADWDEVIKRWRDQKHLICTLPPSPPPEVTDEA